MSASSHSWWGRQWLLRIRPDGPTTRKRSGRGAQIVSIASDGQVTLRVEENVNRFQARFQAAPIAPEIWDNVFAKLKTEARFAAKLLVGELPEPIEHAFRNAGASLFPGPAEFHLSCNCELADPCPHVDLVLGALAEAIDRDPFLLFEMRGFTPAGVLAALGFETQAPMGPPAEQGSPPLGVTRIDFSAETFRKMRSDVRDLHFHIESPPRVDVLFMLLGEPRGWNIEPSLAEHLLPYVSAASQLARELAYASKDEV